MVGGSGRRTVPADSAATTLNRFILGVLLVLTSACVYFNAVYNANRLFEQGRKDIENGRTGSGEASLGTSIEKAERVVANNPDSRWADDALRLIVRAHLLREEWEEALAAADRLMRLVETGRDSAEIAGYMGLADVNLERPARADSLLSFALEEIRDEKLRSRLLHGRGRARASLGQVDAADEDLRSALRLRPDWLEPRIDRVRLLAEEGRGADVVEEVRWLLDRSFRDFEEREVVETVVALSELDPDAARQALASVEDSELSRDDRARLVKLRADLRMAAGEFAVGQADLRGAASIAPGSAPAMEAELALLRFEFDDLARPEDVYRVKAQLDHILRGRTAPLTRDMINLRDTFDRLDYWLETGNLGYLLAAETARDLLHAPELARDLFIRYADAQPQSVWAPKALLAALALQEVDSSAAGGEEATSAESEGPPDAERRTGAESEGRPDAEQLRQRLLKNYADSPYVGAVTGSDGGGRFQYEELEEALQRQIQRLRRLTDEELRKRRSASGP